jgi:hypothetical protein
MQQLVLKDGKIVATHEMHQEVSDKYPGCDIVTYDKPLPYTEEVYGLMDDPRTDEEKKQVYKDKRRLDYPTVTDQLDMIYHDAMDGTTTWKDAITAIKAKHPKPIEIKQGRDYETSF